MKNTVCSVCGAINTLEEKTKTFSAKYAQKIVNVNLPILVCSNCGAKFDIKNNDNNIRKEAMITARNKSVAETLTKLEENYSYTELERNLSLPPKTFSKWKTETKAPSAAAAALVSLLGVFPWLSYVGMVNYEPNFSYKLAAAALLKKASEDENIKTCFLSNESYDIMGIINDKTEKCKVSISKSLESPYNYSFENKIISKTISYNGGQA